MSEPLFDKVAVVGLGLIGSSIARGIEERGLAASIAGLDGSDDVRHVPARSDFATSSPTRRRTP
ncbi:MAG: hypothetical protein A49_25240 [Methyloceanibacter sp.]|nr:MAG: hypothetical protein A49_25240 [Methyloceanibacter sp.]